MKLYCSFLLYLSIMAFMVLEISIEPVVSVEGEAKPAAKSSEESSQDEKLELPEIFNFDDYKKIFHKDDYLGVEDSVRRKYMLARAFRVWISSLKYRHGDTSYWLALNKFSDWTKQEVERVTNKQSADDMEDSDDSQQVDLSSIPEVNPKFIEDDLKKLTSGRSGQVEDEEGLRELQDELRRSQHHQQQHRTSSRTKREAQEEIRQLDDSQLISVGENVHLDAETAAKVEWRPASNNPDYEAPDMISMGVRDENLHTVNVVNMEEGNHQTQSFFANKSRLRVRPWLEGTGGPRPDLPDEVYLDHRDSKCLLLPRDQDHCGCCYAFSFIALAEWLHCKHTGKLVAFSEQYMIDCGKATGKSNGCDGATQLQVIEFVRNYGLELAVNYPYRAREEECPYDEDTEPKTMGYMRMDFGSAMVVPHDLLEDYLPLSPLVLSIKTPADFLEYGGGVYDGKGCRPNSGHSILLVGHGRQLGREYWLIRNSFGVGWGEKGYYKLAKDADCTRKIAVMYGNEDAIANVKPEKNNANDRKPVKSKYAKRISKDLKDDKNTFKMPFGFDIEISFE